MAPSVPDLVLSSLEELVQAYRLEPISRGYLTNGEQVAEQIPATIGFVNEQGQLGRLLLLVPPSATAAMGLITNEASHLDWLAELANQFLGRLKNKLLCFGVCVEMGTPSLSAAPVLPAKAIGPAAQWFMIETAGGRILAAAEGLPSDDQLGPQTAVGFLSEGDCELF